MIYCKYCGLELEDGSCKCEQFLCEKRETNKSRRVKKCDTCGKAIDLDAVFCPYCGIIQTVDGNIKELKEELRGAKSIDVLEFYRRVDEANGIKNSKLKKSPVRAMLVFILSLAVLSFAFFTYLFPIIKQKIDYYNLKQQLLNAPTSEYPNSNAEAEAYYSTYENTEVSSELIEETVQPRIELKDTWVRRDGFIYSFDKNGDPIVDDWVTEVDESGNEQKYYFDIDGKLVVDSWIDGEYYVDANGAMLKNTKTPDGAEVGEDGKVIIKESVKRVLPNETHVYYEEPNLNAETVAPSQQKSSVSGEIKGVKAGKTYELYVKDIIQMRETVTKGDLRCNIIYYIPVIDGQDEREVQIFNEQMLQIFDAFKNQLITAANLSPELPRSITFNAIEQRTVGKNRMIILVHGKVLPRKGLYEKQKFRIVYDRKARRAMIEDISRY